ncbi:hypothetical protein K439DRAFT_1629461 [Ramaria rubella]|nr:hypothetical protein K439DRAFT_1629461 [Ramaria rubella]
MEWFWSIAVLRLVPLLLPAVHAVLDERSKVYFRETREKWYNKKLEEFSPEGPVRDAHWKALNEAFDQVAAIMEKNGPGVDFVAGGDEPTWADIFIVSYLAWIKAVLPDEWENRVKKWSGGKWATLMDKTEQWREVH